MSYDFTVSSSRAYGNNLILKGSRYCIPSGDCNQDGIVNLTDQSLVDNAIYSSYTGYDATDGNGNLIVAISDAIIADNSAFRFAYLQSPLQDQLSQNMPSQSKEKTTDLNGDNAVEIVDAAIADNNALNFVSKIRP